MRYKEIKRILLALIVMLFLTGCGNLSPDEGGESVEDTQDLLEGTTGLFLIKEHNLEEDFLVLYSYESGEEYRYQYNIDTKFYDKYGRNEPMARFSVGRVVELDKKTPQGFLTAVRISAQVWEQSNVVRFSINEEKGVFTIGEVNYSIKDSAKVYSNNNEIALADLWEEDVLNVVGYENQILSVDVVRGHGVLKLVNTALFNDSVFNVGDQLYEKVSEGVALNVPEGTYAFTVAKDGWGSTTEITITRGQTTEIDLETVKGDGPKKGKVSFTINVEDVKVYIDRQLIDHTQVIELVYGTHTLEIVAPGYTSWRKKLVVGAESATIIVELEEETSSEKESEKDSEGKKDGKSEST